VSRERALERVAIGLGYVGGTILWILLAGPERLTAARGTVMVGASVLTLGAVVRALRVPPGTPERPRRIRPSLPVRRLSAPGAWVAYGAGIASWIATVAIGRRLSAAVLLGMASGLVWTTLAVVFALIRPRSDEG
jgi:hypothetical protein